LKYFGDIAAVRSRSDQSSVLSSQQDTDVWAILFMTTGALKVRCLH